MENNATTPSALDTAPDLHHRFAVAADSLYKGTINALSLPGYAVDAVNNAPRLFGYEKLSEHPFMGSESIHNGLTAAYDAFNHFIGNAPPEKADATDEVIGFVGEQAPSLLAGGAALKSLTAPAAGAELLAATPGTAAKTLGKGALNTAWTVAKHPFRTMQAAAGLTTTAVVGDLALNDGRATGWGLGKLFDSAVHAVTGDASFSDAWDHNAPEGLKQVGDTFMGFAKDNPEIAKWGSFALALLGGNAVFGKVIGSILGDNPLSALLSLAVAALAGWKMSDSFSAAAQNYTPHANKPAAALKAEDKPETKRVIAPAPAPF
jgi:hypothetical protein